MADLAEDLTLLLLSPDDWRDLGYRHTDPARGALGLAVLAEPWVGGGPAPTAETLRQQLPKLSGTACPRAVEALAASGRVERQQASSALGRLFQHGQASSWRVVDRAGRQAVADRVAGSLGAPAPAVRDATLAVLLWTSGKWARTGFDGAEPLPRVEGPEPEPWGPLGARARDLSTGAVVPAGVTDPGVLPLLARALSLGDLVTRLQ